MRTLTLSFALATLLATAGCADMTAKQRNTAIGAGVGGVAGATLIGGRAPRWAAPRLAAWSAMC